MFSVFSVFWVFCILIYREKTSQKLQNTTSALWCSKVFWRLARLMELVRKAMVRMQTDSHQWWWSVGATAQSHPLEKAVLTSNRHSRCLRQSATDSDQAHRLGFGRAAVRPDGQVRRRAAPNPKLHGVYLNTLMIEFSLRLHVSAKSVSLATDVSNLETLASNARLKSGSDAYRLYKSNSRRRSTLIAF